MVRYVVNIASAGDSEVAPAVPGFSIILQSAYIDLEADTLRFESGAGGTALSGMIQLPAAATHATMTLPHNEQGWIQTAEGESLSIETTGATVDVQGFINVIYI